MAEMSRLHKVNEVVMRHKISALLLGVTFYSAISTSSVSAMKSAFQAELTEEEKKWSGQFSDAPLSELSTESQAKVYCFIAQDIGNNDHKSIKALEFLAGLQYDSKNDDFIKVCDHIIRKSRYNTVRDEVWDLLIRHLPYEYILTVRDFTHRIVRLYGYKTPHRAAVQKLHDGLMAFATSALPQLKDEDAQAKKEAFLDYGIPLDNVDLDQMAEIYLSAAVYKGDDALERDRSVDAQKLLKEQEKENHLAFRYLNKKVSNFKENDLNSKLTLSRLVNQVSRIFFERDDEFLKNAVKKLLNREIFDQPESGAGALPLLEWLANDEYIGDKVVGEILSKSDDKLSEDDAVMIKIYKMVVDGSTYTMESRLKAANRLAKVGSYNKSMNQIIKGWLDSTIFSKELTTEIIKLTRQEEPIHFSNNILCQAVMNNTRYNN